MAPRGDLSWLVGRTSGELHENYFLLTVSSFFGLKSSSMYLGLLSCVFKSFLYVCHVASSQWKYTESVKDGPESLQLHTRVNVFMAHMFVSDQWKHQKRSQMLHTGLLIFQFQLFASPSPFF